MTQFPSLKATGCGDQVCLPEDQAAQLWLWIRDVGRWMTTASVCLDNRSALPEGAPARPATQKDTWSQVYLEQYEVIVAMSEAHPKVKVDVRWLPCDEDNSYYTPKSKVIWLCTEMAKYPGAALFVAAHEMGHAIAMQRLYVEDEESADEVAALALLKMGRAQAVLDAALWFKSMPDYAPSSSGHPTHWFRAWNLACLAAGWEDTSSQCGALYLGTKLRWERRLGK